MKKLFIMCSLIIVSLCFYGCSKKVDYSEFSFTDVNWVRTTEYDTETISFGSDGFFSYSCACGNPVNDADLCEVYSYNDKTKMIELECIEPAEETITKIKLISYDDNTIKLDFDGDIREFTKE